MAKLDFHLYILQNTQIMGAVVPKQSYQYYYLKNVYVALSIYLYLRLL